MDLSPGGRARPDSDRTGCALSRMGSCLNEACRSPGRWEGFQKLLTGAEDSGKRAPLLTSLIALQEMRVAKAELGDKQTCPSCGAKFYDLKRRPAVCPKCSTSFDPSEEVYKVKRVRSRTATAQPDYEDEEEEEVGAKVAVDDGDEAEEEVEETPDLDEAVAEDAPEILDEEDEEEPVVVARAKGDELPDGFSEDDEDVIADDEDGVPLLEEDEAFDDDDLGEVVEDGDEEEADR